MQTERGPCSLRVGVAAGGSALPPWQSACLDRLARVPGVALSPVRAEGAESGGRPGDLDVLLHLGGPLPEGLGAPRFGTWAFLFGPGGRRSGVEPGRWEIRRGEPVTEAALVRLEGRGERGRVLRRAVVRTAGRSLTATADAVHRRLARWPAQACETLLAGTELCASGETPLQPGADGAPSALDAAWTLVRVAGHRVRFAVRSLLRHDHWNVGVARVPIAAFLDGARPPIAWLPAPGRSRVLADPFGLEHDGRLTLLCEWLEYGPNGKGCIVAVDASGDAGARTPVELGPPVHRSYPYLFRHDGAIWCVPETHEAREVALYRADPFPTRWRRVATLLDDVAAVDPTIFRHDGRWWLAHGDVDEGEHEDLFLWHAPALEGPWQPHIANPVKTDVRSARPAGTPFVHAGALHRPAQDCSVEYGARVAINRVLRLTPHAFEEEPVAWVEPDPASPWPDGLHTLAAAGGYTIVDGKRLAFSPGAGLASLQRTLVRYLGRRPGTRTAPAPMSA